MAGDSRAIAPRLDKASSPAFPPAPPKSEQEQQIRVRTLPCWQEPVEIAPLSRDCGAAAFRVSDGKGVYVARVGQNLRVHSMSRQREAAAHRAAHAAGLAPRVVYAGDDALVREFVA